MTPDNPEIIPTHRSTLASVFDWMPICALILDSYGDVLEVNQSAVDFFRATTKEDFIFDKQNIRNTIVDASLAVELIKTISNSAESVKKEILVRRFDKTIAAIDLTACHFPEDPAHILFQFTEVEIHKQRSIFELSRVYRRESLKLRPYLNKPGKDLLDQLAFSDFLEGENKIKQSKKSQSEMLDDRLINKLTELYPQLSDSELIICGFLSLKLSVDEIAALTEKTPNSLRVSFHRILQKTDFTSGKELLRKLTSIQY